MEEINLVGFVDDTAEYFTTEEMFAMGQYFRPVNVSKKEFLISHDYNSGSRIMEHSWMGNEFVRVVEDLLSPNGDWYRNRIVWAGDYMDYGVFLEDKEAYENLFERTEPEFKKIKPLRLSCANNRYLVNHTKREYLDKKKVQDIHPLPLLTSSGNGRGKGDYVSSNESEEQYVGSWAGDQISVESSIPYPYKEIIPNFSV